MIECKSANEALGLGANRALGDAMKLGGHGANFRTAALGHYSFTGRCGALPADGASPISSQRSGYWQVYRGDGETLLAYRHARSLVAVGAALARG